MKISCILLLLACAPALAGASPSAQQQNVPQAVKAVCASCHGVDGNSVMSTDPKLAGQHADYLFKQLSEFQSGKRANAVMAGMVQGIKTEDMRVIAHYFSTQKPALAQAKNNGAGSSGERIYRAGIAAHQVPACAACHGASGAGLPKLFPRLAGQHADYTLSQLNAFRNGTRANAPMMSVIANKMSDAEMNAVADYIQGLR